jgi:hypothetical protein
VGGHRDEGLAGPDEAPLLRRWVRGGLLWALLATAGAAGAAAQEGATPSPLAGGDLAYATALVAAKANPARADFRDLRLAFTQSRAYVPYRAGYPDQGPAMAAAMKAEEWPKVAQLAQAALDASYVRMRPHFYASLAYRRLGDRERAAHHRAFFDGLYRSIVEGSDGQSAATAYQVISIEEEYDVLAVRRLRKDQQAITDRDGRKIDVITARGADGAVITLYFDVTLAWARSGEERRRSPGR